jgi:hypothetical protein
MKNGNTDPAHELFLQKGGSADLSDEQMLRDFSPMLENDFPNPERIGCPDAALLKGIAAGKVKLASARKWLPHLGSCSECYRDFLGIKQRTSQRRRMKIWIGLVAAILLVCLSATLLVMTRSRTSVSQFALLDLRDRSELRTAESPETQLIGPALTVRRLDAEVSIYLPVASPPGSYEVQLLDAGMNRQLALTSAGRIENHITVLRLHWDLSALSAGAYSLGIRRPGLNWSFYPVSLK